eukprot:GEMP01041292.1.p1 GENE.GEMP01041292.1~~GEMP01041292.1.p1  ORF type:complete len:158 (+),score=14.08 GEMP01041292.1:725-1198(+)
MPRRRDVEDGSPSDDEEEPLIQRRGLAGLIRKACFWARICEGICVTILFPTSLGVEGCFFFSHTVLFFSLAMMLHMIFFIIPLRGRFRLLTAFRVSSPWKSVSILLPGMCSCLVVYFTFLGGCPALRNSLFFTIVPILLYFLAIQLGERGNEMLWSS